MSGRPIRAPRRSTVSVTLLSQMGVHRSSFRHRVLLLGLWTVKYSLYRWDGMGRDGRETEESERKLTAMHMHPAPAISQHHTAAALPPAVNGKEKVVATVENSPLMLTAKEKVDR